MCDDNFEEVMQYFWCNQTDMIITRTITTKSPNINGIEYALSPPNTLRSYWCNIFGGQQRPHIKVKKTTILSVIIYLNDQPMMMVITVHSVV